MNLKERIEFFKKANMGDSVEIEYQKLLSSKTKTINGKISGMYRDQVWVLKPNRDLFLDGHNYCWHGWIIDLDKVVRADVTKKANYTDS